MNELLEICRAQGKRIPEIVLEQENTWRSEAETRQAILKIWNVMKECVRRGLHTTGVLPGFLAVPRRAASLYAQMLSEEEVRVGCKFTCLFVCFVSLFLLKLYEQKYGFDILTNLKQNIQSLLFPSCSRLQKKGEARRALISGTDCMAWLDVFALAVSEVSPFNFVLFAQLID
jgi:hypothetical protein